MPNKTSPESAPSHKIDSPNQITLLERGKLMQEAAHRYITGSIDYQTLTVLRRRLFQPKNK